MSAAAPARADVTAVEVRTAGRGPAPARARRIWAAGGALVLAVALLAVLHGGAGIVNTAGWPQLRAFLVAAANPETSAGFLRLTWDATLTTVAYAVLGTALAMLLGLTGGVLLAETWWRRGHARGTRPRSTWYAARALLALPRGVHEAVWGLALVAVLGLDPLVGVLAIAIPFGAVSAKVVGELVDEAAAGPYQALRAAGAGRVAALLYAVLPIAGPDIVSYGFYRLECAIRSAAVLGIIGAGGLGFELALSFQALRYEEMWTLVYALAAVSGLTDLWSSRLRRAAAAGRRPGRASRRSLAGAALLIGLSLAHLPLDLPALWAPGTRRLAADVAGGAWPPAATVGLRELLRLSLDTLWMSVVGIAAAGAAAVPAAFVAARPPTAGAARAVAGLATRTMLLLSRAIPPPVWAFVLLLVLFPGPLPGAVALAAYNFGILGRLMAEVVENLDRRPAAALGALGATPAQVFAYGVVPVAAGRFSAYALYRWEVALRETVIVGLVGAGGLGRLLAQQMAAFDHAGALATVITLIALSALVDLVSQAARRALR